MYRLKIWYPYTFIRAISYAQTKIYSNTLLLKPSKFTLSAFKNLCMCQKAHLYTAYNFRCPYLCFLTHMHMHTHTQGKKEREKDREGERLIFGWLIERLISWFKDRLWQIHYFNCPRNEDIREWFCKVQIPSFLLLNFVICQWFFELTNKKILIYTFVNDITAKVIQMTSQLQFYVPKTRPSRD